MALLIACHRLPVPCTAPHRHRVIFPLVKVTWLPYVVTRINCSFSAAFASNMGLEDKSKLTNTFGNGSIWGSNGSVSNSSSNGNISNPFSPTDGLYGGNKGYNWPQNPFKVSRSNLVKSELNWYIFRWEPNQQVTPTTRSCDAPCLCRPLLWTCITLSHRGILFFDNDS